jgi:hypothetical protein
VHRADCPAFARKARLLLDRTTKAEIRQLIAARKGVRPRVVGSRQDAGAVASQAEELEAFRLRTSGGMSPDEVAAKTFARSFIFGWRTSSAELASAGTHLGATNPAF